MIVKKGILHIALVLFLAFAGCVPQKQVRVNRNLSYLYIPGRTPLHPEYLIYHNSDTLSTLKIKVQPVQLLFNQANKEGKYLSLLTLRYRLYEIGRQRHLSDSGRVQYFIDLDQLKGDFRANILLHCALGKQYILETIAADQIRKTAIQNFLFVDKQTNHTSQDFLVTDVKDNKALFTAVADSRKRFHIIYRKGMADTFFISYFLPDTTVPPPPDLMVAYPAYGRKADSTWQVPVTDTSTFSLPAEGVYLFRTDTAFTTGKPLYNFGKYYPYIRTPEQMASPLVYLLNETEMSNLMTSENLKLAVDDFWLHTSDNIEKSRELIRLYYNRVFYANVFFTSYKEGWRTDRGMIYIIYGPPDNLVKTESREIWTYGEDKNPNKLTFTFIHKAHPFSLNHFVLFRGENAESRWRQAVRTWRQGSVFVVGKS
ncbi:MAG: GWxTD domain-containing protein [Chlorobi bacterium]|nr:GWxTD domain-containing protein [Chlorobiota bacterium]